MKILVFFAMFVVTSLPSRASEATKYASYSGEYFYNFENAIFSPDGTQEDWCLDGVSMKKAELPTNDARGAGGTSHVVLRGKLGPRGSYGGLGRCKHVLTVKEIVEITNMRRPGK